MKRIFSIITALILVSSYTFGTNNLQVPDVNVAIGGETALEVSLNNTDVVSAFQCDVTIPSGMIAGNVVKSERLGASHSVATTKLSDTKMRIVCYSNTNASITGAEGLLFSIPLSIPNEYSTGICQASFSDIVLSDSAGQVFMLDAISCSITVEKSDQIITWVQSFDNAFVGESIELSAASSSGLPIEYSITQGSALVQITDNVLKLNEAGMVSITASQPGNSKFNKAEDVTKTFDIVSRNPECYFTIPPLTMQKGKTGSLEVSLTAKEPITSFQCDISCTDPLSISNVALSDDVAKTHVITSSTVSGGIHRVICYSLTNQVLPTDCNNLFTIDIQTAEDAEYGTNVITMSNIIGVTPRGQSINCGISESEVTIAPDFILGDVDSSGDVTVTDAVKIVDYILEKEPEGFNKAAADVNHDNNITVGDVVSVVDIVLGKK